MDLLGPFPKSTRNKKNVIVATDYLTRFVKCPALRDGTSAQVAKFFYGNIVCRYGAPARILTDRGKNFQSHFIETIYQLLRTKHTHTTPYHPATNRLTERFNKTLAMMLSMYVNISHTNWHESLPFVIFAYNTMWGSAL